MGLRTGLDLTVTTTNRTPVGSHCLTNSVRVEPVSVASTRHIRLCWTTWIYNPRSIFTHRIFTNIYRLKKLHNRSGYFCAENESGNSRGQFYETILTYTCKYWVKSWESWGQTVSWFKSPYQMGDALQPLIVTARCSALRVHNNYSSHLLLSLDIIRCSTQDLSAES